MDDQVLTIISSLESLAVIMALVKENEEKKESNEIPVCIGLAESCFEGR